MKYQVSDAKDNPIDTVEAARINFEPSGHISFWTEHGYLIVAYRADTVYRVGDQ